MGDTLLVADDEPGIVQLIKDFFELQDYKVITAVNGIETLEKLSMQPDIILLDVNMPGMDGFEVCRRIRGHVSCPILFLTAKIEEQDRINGLNVGGDDYIMKPFSIEELGARVEAHLRREKRKNITTAVKMSDDLAIHYAERVIYYNEQPISLTRTEFDIMELLSMNPGQVFGKEQIYEKVRGIEGIGDNTIVTEHIRRIRSKIEQYTKKPYIETVWGVGYKWIG